MERNTNRKRDVSISQTYRQVSMKYENALLRDISEIKKRVDLALKSIGENQRITDATKELAQKIYAFSIKVETPEEAIKAALRFEEAQRQFYDSLDFIDLDKIFTHYEFKNIGAYNNDFKINKFPVTEKECCSLFFYNKKKHVIQGRTFKSMQKVFGIFSFSRKEGDEESYSLDEIEDLRKYMEKECATQGSTCKSPSVPSKELYKLMLYFADGWKDFCKYQEK